MWAHGDRYNIPRMQRVTRTLFDQQMQNLHKAAPTSFRYYSELVLDFSFEVWFHGGMFVCECVRVPVCACFHL